MDCGIPYCHVFGCPVVNRIPEWNDMVHRKQWRKALTLLHATCNLPEITGRVCPAPCEAACTLAINLPPVTIRHIELQIVEMGWQEGWIRPEPAHRKTGRKVGVIGSGPAGLAAAQQLARKGHEVVVFEKADRVGGLLRYGIPDFKLEKWVIDRPLEQMRAEGVVFETGVNAGTDISVKYLGRTFDAIVIAAGATVPRDLPTQQKMVIGGETLPEGGRITARDKHVVVIGGGDTGSDCVGTSRRQGASEIHQLELLPMPPAERTVHNPWPTWPVIMRTSSSQEEGCTRLWSVSTKEFLGSRNGVEKMRCVRIEWPEPDGNGRSTFREIPGRSEERRVGEEGRSRWDWSSDVCSSDLISREPERCRKDAVRQDRVAGAGRERAEHLPGNPGVGVRAGSGPGAARHGVRPRGARPARAGPRAGNGRPREPGGRFRPDDHRAGRIRGGGRHGRRVARRARHRLRQESGGGRGPVSGGDIGNRGYFSSRIVTGPSFTSSTSICAPNKPDSTGREDRPFRIASIPRNKGSALPGRSAASKPGRFPFCASPYRVNCETTRTPPPTSATDRFIFPASSSKILSLTIFSAIQATSALSSACPKPANTSSPRPIPPRSSPPEVTDALLTLCTTTRMGEPPSTIRSDPTYPSLRLRPSGIGKRKAARRGMALPLPAIRIGSAWLNTAITSITMVGNRVNVKFSSKGKFGTISRNQTKSESWRGALLPPG